jgi:formylglycine-generating enzyme required for sulfatase activity
LAGLAPLTTAWAAGATRDLPDEYVPGMPFTVTIAIQAPPGTAAMGLEDSPPPGWTGVTAISGGGSYDVVNCRVKWGPFFAPSIPDSVSYQITPPADAVGTQCFAGVISFDGIQYAIGGDECIPHAQPGASMVLIPAGEFQMGDTFEEGNANELPTHAVYVDAFYMDTHEVTSQQYADALNWAKNQGNLITVTSGVVYKYNTGTSYPYCDTTTSSSYSRITWNGSTFGVVSGKENHPMVGVSWYGSVAYCNWRSGMEGKPLCYDLSTWTCNFGSGYRLPTEAEWEKAARGGVAGRRFPWSDTDTIQHARANYYSYWSGGAPYYPYDTNPTEGYHPTFAVGSMPYTSPVGYFAPNGYGLYDMAGNVWEWCHDRYSASYYETYPTDGWPPNPTGPSSGGSRVLRGGGWGGSAVNCRVAFRTDYVAPVHRHDGVGFRCAVGVVETDIAVLSCSPLEQTGMPGGTVTVEVYVSNVTGLNAYQVQVAPVLISGTGTLTLNHCLVDEARSDFVFYGLSPTSACNPATAQAASVAAGSATVTIPATERAYLGTFVYDVSGDAEAGTLFEVRIQPEPASLLLDPPSQSLPFTIDPPCEIEVVRCDPPIVTAEGGRYLQVELGPLDSVTPQGIRITSPDCPGWVQWVDADGCLTDAAQFQTAEEWGTVHVTGSEFAPSFTYEITSLCGGMEKVGGTASATTWLWGDVNNDTVVNVVDIQKVLQCAEGTFYGTTTVYNTDLVSDCLNPGCDIFDVFAVLDAWLGVPYPGPVPCGGRATSEGLVLRGKTDATVELVVNVSKCAPGDLLTVDAYVRNVTDLRGYQLQLEMSGGEAGSLACSELSIDRTRPDYVFQGAGQDWTFLNVDLCRLSSSLTQGGVTVGDDPKYLGTFVLASTPDAMGSFTLKLTAPEPTSVLLNSTGQSLSFTSPDVQRGFGTTPVDWDTDCDGDVDLEDYVSFEGCMGGPDTDPMPTLPTTAADCLAVLDGNLDADVDVEDFAAFAESFADTGSGR